MMPQVWKSPGIDVKTSKHDYLNNLVSLHRSWLLRKYIFDTTKLYQKFAHNLKLHFQKTAPKMIKVTKIYDHFFLNFFVEGHNMITEIWSFAHQNEWCFFNIYKWKCKSYNPAMFHNMMLKKQVIPSLA